MSSEDIFKFMADSIVDLDEEKALILAQKAITDGLNILNVIEKGFGEGIRRVGDLWDEGEFFLPELMRGAQIMQKTIEVLTPSLQASQATREIAGRAVHPHPSLQYCSTR